MVWFYPKRRNAKRTQRILRLSIPLWSDFIRILGVYYYIKKYSFQSHYGLILSPRGWDSRFSESYTFNPTMVWFYHFRVQLIDYAYISFQSHYGLILSSDRWSHSRGSNIYFQSHYGLILSEGLTPDVEECIDSFNPTMVWFYHSTFLASAYLAVFLSIPLWSDFII